MACKKIEVARLIVSRDYSPYPAGRYRRHGNHSGEAFREDHVAPALRAGCVIVELDDGVCGYSPGWLEEVFGGLIRECGFGLRFLQERLLIAGTAQAAKRAADFLHRAHHRTRETNMKIIVTRHPALVEYLVREGLAPAGCDVITHASAEDVQGRHVIGVLPLYLAAEAERVTVVPLRMPPELRGVELTVDQVAEFAGDPQTFVVTRENA